MSFFTLQHQVRKYRMNLKNPHLAGLEDVQALKEMGWKEIDIFDALAHGARSVATNIIFDAFKVDRESC
jgi:hypothetical protein